MRNLFLYCCLLIMALGCKQSYEPPFTAPDKGYLVVESNIIRTGPSQVALSRTIKLADTDRQKYERQAQVSVEGKDNSKYVFTETNPGLYTTSLNLVPGQQYRLRIKTKDGKEYLSSYVDVKLTPAIDSVAWARENGNVQTYIHTHDAQNNTRYYRWSYDETWQFTSSILSSLHYTRDASGGVKGIDYRFPDMRPDISIYTCWQSEASKRILIGSSAKLANDIIYLPMNIVPAGTWKISVLYSINVKQYGISREEYEFLSKMKKNTEETGSLFDPQPSELKGNIHCTTDANEPVIGFAGISEMKEKRIFIKNSEVPGWGYRESCTEIDLPNNPDTIKAYAYLEPTNPYLISTSGAILRYLAAEPVCVDCTTRGTNVKPSFWP